MLQAVLSSIVIVALQGMFMKAKDVKKYYQLSLPDMVGHFYLATIKFSILLIVHMDCDILDNSFSWNGFGPSSGSWVWNVTHRS